MNYTNDKIIANMVRTMKKTQLKAQQYTSLLYTSSATKDLFFVWV